MRGNPLGAGAKVLYCNLEVSEFELLSFYLAHFRTNTPKKGMTPLSPSL